MDATFLFIGLGYLFGSLLFAERVGKLITGKSIVALSDDKNPGTYNAFKYGGFACGCLTLAGDLLKGFLPVYLYSHLISETGIGLSLVMASPIFGHMFPIFHKFKGGKGIAVSFGVLLGLLPQWRPLAVLAVLYVFFSCGLKIKSHTDRTIVTYLGFSMILLLITNEIDTSMMIGGWLISGLVTFRHLTCAEYKRKKVKEIL